MVFWWWWWCSGYLHPLVFSRKIWFISSLSIPRLIDAYSNDAYSNDVYSNVSILSIFILYDITCWAICAHSCLIFQLRIKLLRVQARIRGKPRWIDDTLHFILKFYLFFRNWCLIKCSVVYARTKDVMLRFKVFELGTM